MPEYTSKLQLVKPLDGEDADQEDFNKNFQKLDENVGAFICTSGSRPTGAARFTSQVIFETDTKKVYMWDGTAWRNPGLTDWVDVTFLNGWSNFGRPAGLPNPAATGWQSQVELAPVRYRLDGDRLEIAGSAKNVVGANGRMFDLAPDFRPKRTYAVIVPANAGVAEVRVYGDGAVIVTNYYAGGSAQVINMNFHLYLDA